MPESGVPAPDIFINTRQPRRTRQVKHQIIEMKLNGNGVRDIARVLHISPAIVIRELKKISQIGSVNQKLLPTIQSE
ncbi:IS1-like element transposase [Nostoc sp. ATCC 53789]|uniref:IS1-like element transposase n=1 Tax=Nostoc sp. ATCC 53789 TaxID=76335 RepID=UPI001FD762A1|nr:IS1-like element transposase [Nostoc sp. ATCC 53789]